MITKGSGYTGHVVISSEAQRGREVCFSGGLDCVRGDEWRRYVCAGGQGYRGSGRVGFSPPIRQRWGPRRGEGPRRSTKPHPTPADADRNRDNDVRRRGFTLAEAVLATVVLGIAAAGVLLPFASGARVRAEGMRRTLAAKLAGDLMAVVVQTPFDEIVSTYDGYAESQGQVKDAAGVVFSDPAYAPYSRDVSCDYVRVPQEEDVGEWTFIRITVRVCYNGKELVAVNRLVCE